ncbi:MAG: hypothetical protein WCC53_15050 [Thermoanaerobaculia bacterium]
MLIRKLACILVVAALATDAAAKCGEKSPGPACLVVVTRDRIFARFPPPESPATTWHWQRRSTNDNQGEYSWRVRFGFCSGQEEELKQDYSRSLEINIFKFPGAAERAGTFEKLMTAAQGDLWKCDSTGSRCVRERRIRFTGRSELDFIEISITRDPAVDALIEGRPPVAVLSGRTPDQALYCYATVEYR